MCSLKTEKPFSHVIKGKVTQLNKFLLYFTIDRTTRIYIDITKVLPEFPCENDEVEIINPIKFNGKTETAIIGPKTVCNFPNICTVDHAKHFELFSVLKANNLDEDEIIAMDNIIRQLEPLSTGDILIQQDILTKCLITLFHNAPFSIKCFQESTKSFKKCQIKLATDFNYVNENSHLYNFIKFDGMCSYNVYPSRSLRKVTDCYAEYLFGILDVDPVFGYFSLSNKIASVPVKFESSNKILYGFNNSLVMCKKWTVFTEIFQERDVSPLKYIVLNVDDVIVIESMRKSNWEELFFLKNTLWDTGQRKTIFLQTVRISEVIYGYSNSPECWIEALLSETGNSFNSFQLIYVILSNRHCTIVPFLRENIVYQLFYYEEPKLLKIESHKELFRQRRSKILYRLGKDTVFQECDKPPIAQNEIFLNNFDEVEKFVRTSNQRYFSFCLKVDKKLLQENLNYKFASHIPKRCENLTYFGTPGKNKQMRLAFWNPVTNSYIDLYLSDRDNHVTPLGLLDDMRVKVNHVEICKNKYIKTNVFSSFEIVEFCPEIEFSSVNLYFCDKLTWHWRDKTPKTMLGMYSLLPRKCIVHGSFLLKAVQRLKVVPVCDRCKKVSVPEKPCMHCNITDRDLNINMSICVQDYVNPMFYMDTEDKNFLFELLGLRSSIEIKHFRNAFLSIGATNVNFCDMDNFYMCTKDEESKMFLDKLIKMIKFHINYSLYPLVEAVCVKEINVESYRWKIIEFLFSV